MTPPRDQQSPPVPSCEVLTAIGMVHQMAAPHASAANAVIGDYSSIAELCRACLPNSSYKDLCTALRQIVVAANKRERYTYMCEVGLPHAFRALFEHLHQKISQNAGCAVAWARRLRLCCSALKCIADNNRGFWHALRAADVHLVASRLFKSVNIPQTSADAVCSVLAGLLKGQRDLTLLDSHMHGATAGLVVHFQNTLSQQQLLETLLHCCSSCKSILKCPLKARHIIGHLCMSVENCSGRDRLAARSLCLLLEADNTRASSYIWSHNQDFATVLCTQVSGPSTRCGALQIIQSTLCPNRSSRSQSVKDRLHTRLRWSRKYGAELCTLINEALGESCGNETQAAGVCVIRELLELQQLTVSGYKETLETLKRSLQILLKAMDSCACFEAVEAMCFAALGARLLPVDLGIKVELTSLKALCGARFQDMCEDLQVYIPVEQTKVGGDCGVCTMAFNADERTPMLLQCDHIFCCECLHRWFQTSTTCPLCRSAGLNVMQEIMGEDVLFKTRQHLRERDLNS